MLMKLLNWQKHKAKYCKRPRLFVFGMLALQRYINILCKYKIYFKNTDNNNLKINLMKRYYINRRRSNGIESSLWKERGYSWRKLLWKLLNTGCKAGIWVIIRSPETCKRRIQGEKIDLLRRSFDGKNDGK